MFKEILELGLITLPDKLKFMRDNMNKKFKKQLVTDPKLGAAYVYLYPEESAILINHKKFVDCLLYIVALLDNGESYMFSSIDNYRIASVIDYAQLKYTQEVTNLSVYSNGIVESRYSRTCRDNTIPKMVGTYTFMLSWPILIEKLKDIAACNKREINKSKLPTILFSNQPLLCPINISTKLSCCGIHI